MFEDDILAYMYSLTKTTTREIGRGVQTASYLLLRNYIYAAFGAREALRVHTRTRPVAKNTIRHLGVFIRLLRQGRHQTA